VYQIVLRHNMLLVESWEQQPMLDETV